MILLSIAGISCKQQKNDKEKLKLSVTIKGDTDLMISIVVPEGWQINPKEMHSGDSIVGIADDDKVIYTGSKVTNVLFIKKDEGNFLFAAIGEQGNKEKDFNIEQNKEILVKELIEKGVYINCITSLDSIGGIGFDKIKCDLSDGHLVMYLSPLERFNLLITVHWNNKKDEAAIVEALNSFAFKRIVN